MEFPQMIRFLRHGPDQESIRNRNDDWKAFWDSNNNHSYTKYEGIKHINQVLVVGNRSGFGMENFDKDVRHHSNEGNDSTIETRCTDLFRNCFKFFLKWCHIPFDIHEQACAANKGVRTNSDDNCLCGTSHN